MDTIALMEKKISSIEEEKKMLLEELKELKKK
jgi:hypothetical protein